MTVCLVVLGRHVPQLQFFGVILGNEPVLSLEETFRAGKPPVGPRMVAVDHRHEAEPERASHRRLPFIAAQKTLVSSG